MNKILTTILLAASLLFGVFIGNLYQDNQKPFGASVSNLAYTTQINASSTVAAATSTLILGSNTGRKYALISNDSANIVYLSFGSVAVSGKGVRLNANGGTYEITDVNLFLGDVYGYSSATSSIAVTELR